MKVTFFFLCFLRSKSSVLGLAPIIFVLFVTRNGLFCRCTYHKDDPPPPEDDENKEKRTDDISSWDSDFLKVDQGTLFELILAANYLDIKVHDSCRQFLKSFVSVFSKRILDT